MTIQVVLVEQDLARRDELAEALLRHGVGGVEVAGTLHEAEAVREAARGRGDRPIIADVRDPAVPDDRTAVALGTLQVLGAVLDGALPDHAAWSAEVAGLAGALADRFDIAPAMRAELLQAARVLELSRLASRATEGGDAPASATTRASAGLLRQVPGLEGVADLIEGVGANWDGTGTPPLQRGEIPLRSRLLRLSVDAVRIARRLGSGAGLGAVHGHLAQRAGTWYDPAVVAVLQTVAALDPDGPLAGQRVTEVALDALRVGMVLATDLTTASGTTLMRAGQPLTAHALQVIRARQETDPVTGALLILTATATPEPS